MKDDVEKIKSTHLLTKRRHTARGRTLFISASSKHEDQVTKSLFFCVYILSV